MWLSKRMNSLVANPLHPPLTSPSHVTHSTSFVRSSSSGSRWKQRQGRDVFARDAKVQGLKSRAAFKLLEMDSKYRIFKSGQTVVDLGYAPGSWSQVALERTRPNGQVIGIDLIPAQPPRGVATFQGDFLSPVVRQMVKNFIIQSHLRQTHLGYHNQPTRDDEEAQEDSHIDQPSYIDIERRAGCSPNSTSALLSDGSIHHGLIVDIVLSDMSAPWEQTSGFSSKTLSNPYGRLMNTSGNALRDHAGSMDLCAAALQFSSDILKPGGHLICKFYQGSQDKGLEQGLKRLFTKVYREKPESSRRESKEAYFIALQRRHNTTIN